MILWIVQFGAVGLIALYFAWWRFGAHRRNSQTWETLIGKLRHDWDAHSLSEHFPWKEGLSSSPDQIWDQLGGTRGLWVMFQNARVMLEIADYAARHAHVDQDLLHTIRADATQIRLLALKAIVTYTLNKASDSICINAFQVASAYTGMAARVTQLLQDHAEGALPSFVAAM